MIGASQASGPGSIPGGRIFSKRILIFYFADKFASMAKLPLKALVIEKVQAGLSNEQIAAYLGVRVKKIREMADQERKRWYEQNKRKFEKSLRKKGVFEEIKRAISRGVYSFNDLAATIHLPTETVAFIFQKAERENLIRQFRRYPVRSIAKYARTSAQAERILLQLEANVLSKKPESEKKEAREKLNRRLKQLYEIEGLLRKSIPRYRDHEIRKIKQGLLSIRQKTSGYTDRDLHSFINNYRQKPRAYARKTPRPR